MAEKNQTSGVQSDTMNAQELIKSMPEWHVNQIIAESNDPVLETVDDLVDAIDRDLEGEFDSLWEEYGEE